MAPVVAGAGLVLLVAGALAVAAGLALMVLSQDDASTQDDGDNGVLAEPRPGSGDAGQARVGQTVAVGGGAVVFLGLVFIVIGRADS